MSLHLATFRFDVTPPKGHPLCGGWIKPVVDIDDPLEAIGFVLLGAGAPIVVCSIDWTGILNSAHVDFREVLADAAHTSPDQVAIQSVHQHNAPFVCLESEKYVSAQKDLPHVVELNFWNEVLKRGEAAVKASLKDAKPVSHIATGKGKVERVASNRRFLGPDGKVKQWRGSSCKDPALIELPEGLIDPWLRTVAFYSGSEKLLSLHYYATHPMSYYGDGRVSSDFAGLARKRRQSDEPNVTHIYFTGCSGNIAAGKYNDGTPKARTDLTDRLYAGIVASEVDLTPTPIKEVAWNVTSILPPARPSLVAEELEKRIANPKEALANRIRPAMQLAWLKRVETKAPPIEISSLSIDDVSLLHLPAECFLEYQLRTQEVYPNRFIATAAYGDGGPWYIPIESAYPQGGYEVDVSLCDSPVDDILAKAIQAVIKK